MLSELSLKQIQITPNGTIIYCSVTPVHIIVLLKRKKDTSACLKSDYSQ